MARLLSSETRRRLGENDRRWPIKYGMRAFAIPLAIIATILFAVTTNLSKQNYGGDDWVDGMPLAPVSVKIEILQPFLRQRNERVFETPQGLKDYSLKLGNLG